MVGWIGGTVSKMSGETCIRSWSQVEQRIASFDENLNPQFQNVFFGDFFGEIFCNCGKARVLSLKKCVHSSVQAITTH